MRTSDSTISCLILTMPWPPVPMTPTVMRSLAGARAAAPNAVDVTIYGAAAAAAVAFKNLRRVVRERKDMFHLPANGFA